jgi:hypothetical protein
MAEDVKNRESERSIVSNELDHLLLAHGAQLAAGCAVCKGAFIEWHFRAVDMAVGNAWIPGMAGRQEEPVVEEALSRFHSHHVKAAIAQVTRENANLEARLAMALECIRFYAFGGSDTGACAKKAVMSLVDRPNETNDREMRAPPSLWSVAMSRPDSEAMRHPRDGQSAGPQGRRSPKHH